VGVHGDHWGSSGEEIVVGMFGGEAAMNMWAWRACCK